MLLIDSHVQINTLISIKTGLNGQITLLLLRRITAFEAQPGRFAILTTEMNDEEKIQPSLQFHRLNGVVVPLSNDQIDRLCG